MSFIDVQKMIITLLNGWVTKYFLTDEHCV